MKTWFRIACLGLSVGLTAVAAAGDDALNLLRRALDATYRVNARKIVVYTSDTYENGTLSVSVLQARSGEVLTTVVQPLSMQGLKTMDDGKVLKSYCPDQKKVWHQESPRAHQPDTDYRLAIAQRNYAFVEERTDQTVAGRRIRLVVAKPKNRELPTRHYFIDRETPVILRIETVDRAGQVARVMDTRSVEYPEEVSRVAFRALPESIKPEPVGVPMRTTAAQVGNKVDFQPHIPSRLALGFQIEGVDIIREKGQNLVALRITDGLTTGTIYLWDPKERVNVLNTPGSLERQVDGMMVRVIGDVPAAAKERLLQAFSAKAWDSFLHREPKIEPTALANAYAAAKAAGVLPNGPVIRPIEVTIQFDLTGGGN